MYKINLDELQQTATGLMNDPVCNSLIKKKDAHDKLFAKVILWTLEHEEISCNMLIRTFNLGWNRANQFIERLYDLGIVGDLDAKLPRKVLSQSIDDVSEDVLELLTHNGFSEKTVADFFHKRNL